MTRRRSPRLRIVHQAASPTSFGALVADAANFVVARVPALPSFAARSWTLSCQQPFLTLRIAQGRTELTCASGLFLHEGDPLELIDRLLERLRPSESPGLPFEGGLVGYLGYELLDPPDTNRTELPDAWLAFPRQARITPEGGTDVDVFLDDLPTASELARELGWSRLDDQALARSPTVEEVRRVGTITRHPADPPAERTRQRFVTAVEQCQRLIAAGDIYQANLSHQIEPPFRCDARALATALSARHPSPHQIFIDCGDFQVVGASPELFLRSRAGRIAVRPIKGTRRRGTNAIEDEELRSELAADPKEMAEHVMIVDLERNDLGRVARTGTVQVPELMSIETFGTVHHLVSTVTAECTPSVTVGAILRATFPCGSVTGAPKIRAREVIRELESEPRGLYTGATGFIDCRGELELAVAIRTATVMPDRVRYGVGAGIVADSIAANEWDETLLKAEGFSMALDAVMRSQDPRSGCTTPLRDECAT